MVLKGVVVGGRQAVIAEACLSAVQMAIQTSQWNPGKSIGIQIYSAWNYHSDDPIIQVLVPRLLGSDLLTRMVQSPFRLVQILLLVLCNFYITIQRDC